MAGIYDPDFRVTFDSNIEWNSDCRDLRQIKKGHQLLKKGQRLMEIKIAGAFPIELSGKLSELGIFPTSFSKYGAGYKTMMRKRLTVLPAASRVSVKRKYSGLPEAICS